MPNSRADASAERWQRVSGARVTDPRVGFRFVQPLLILLACGCGGSAESEPPPPPAPAYFDITRDTVLIPVGAVDTLPVSVLDSAGRPVDADLLWSSGNDSVATVSPGGVIQGLTVGRTQLQARFPPTDTVLTATVVVRPSLTVSIAASGLQARHPQGGMWECEYTLMATTSGGVPGDFATWEDSEVEFVLADGTSHVEAIPAVNMADRFRGSLLRRGDHRTSRRVARDEARSFDLAYSFRYTVRGELKSKRVTVDCPFEEG